MVYSLLIVICAANLVNGERPKRSGRLQPVTNHFSPITGESLDAGGELGEAWVSALRAGSA
jgi:hypothetical protein